MAEKQKFHGVLIPKDNYLKKLYATFWLDELQDPIATKGYVDGQINRIIGRAPEDFDSLVELANAIGNQNITAKLLPTGGTANQVLAKRSDSDNDVEWITPDYRSARPYPNTWHTNTTLAEFCSDIEHDQNAIIGEQYLGELTCTGLPDGIGNAEVTVYVTGHNVILLTLTSTNVAPYHWELSYLGGYMYGWRVPNCTPVASNIPQNGFKPNIVYNLGEITGTTTWTIDTSSNDPLIVNHYFWTFETGSTAPTITWPLQINSWMNDVPEIEANHHYEISVLNGVAICSSCELT